MCIYDNVFMFKWYFVIFKAGHFEKLFFNKRYNYGNFSLEYYVKSSITSEYSLNPFSSLPTITFDSKPTSVFCHMGDFGCGDGGWTPVMKMDGNKVRSSLCKALR